MTSSWINANPSACFVTGSETNLWWKSYFDGEYEVKKVEVLLANIEIMNGSLAWSEVYVGATKYGDMDSTLETGNGLL